MTEMGTNPVISTNGRADPTVRAVAKHSGTLGSEVRQLRRARQMTLKKLASASGVSVSHLSAIELAVSKPSDEIIQAIADALNVSANWFHTRRFGNGPMERAYVVRKANRRNLNTLYGEAPEQIGMSDALLSSTIGGNFYMGISEYLPHSERAHHPMYQHEGEQHGLVIEGELEFQLADELVTLRAGDSISFPAKIVHNARNRTSKPARLVWATAPVILPMNVVVESRDTQRMQEI